MKTSRYFAWRAVFTLVLVAWWGAGAAFAQNSANRIAQLEKQLIQKINQERSRSGLAPLEADPTLSLAAREHSADMMRQGAATHESQLPDHQTPDDRYQWAFGASAAKLTENVAVVKAGLEEGTIAGSAAAALNGKPEARRNMIDREVTTVGLGCAVGPDGRIWVTAMFARPAGQPVPGSPSVAATAPSRQEPGPETPPPSENTSARLSAERLEELLAAKIFYERCTNGEQVDPALRQVAREHSADMMRRGAAVHESDIDGHRTPMERYQWAFGAPAQKLAEAVAVVKAGPEQTVVEDAMTALRGGCAENRDRGRKKESELPEVYRQMLDWHVNHVAVGCAVGQDGRYWVTAMYAGNPEYYMYYEGTISPDLSNIFYDFFGRLEAVAQAAAAKKGGPPIQKCEIEWQRQGIRKGAPLAIEMKVDRGKKLTCDSSGIPNWGGLLSCEADSGGQNQEKRTYLKVEFNLAWQPGELEPNGRLTGPFLIGASAFNDSVWNVTRFKGQATWEAIPTDPSRREYRVFIVNASKALRATIDKSYSGADRIFAGTLRLKGSKVAQVAEAPPPLPSAVEPTPPPPVAVPVVAAEPEAPATSEDENRAADIRWLKSIDEALATAERKMAEARDKLVGLKEIIRQREQRIAYLESLLAKPRTPESDGIIEEIFQKGIDAWDEAMNGPKPALGAEPRAVFEGQIERLRQQVSDARKERDELIKTTLETYYDPIAEELEARGPQSNWEEVRKSAKQAIPEVKSLKGLAAAELYLAAGQDEKFEEAVRASIADGRHAADARYLQALYYLDKHDLRRALEGFRLVMDLTKPKRAGETEPLVTSREEAEALASTGDRLWQQARRMAWMVEDGYLQAVDAKASAEAHQVQAEVAERMKAGGDEGWLGCVLAYLKIGLGSMTSAIVHQEDALVNLAAKYEKEVAAQHCGLLLMQSLHERGFPIDKIDQLTNEQFLALMGDYYGEAGAKLEATDGIRLRASIKAALRNPDVSKLISGSKAQLRVDLGEDYFGHKAMAPPSLDSWSNAALMAIDLVNVVNVAMMVMPASTYRVSGKLAGVRYTGRMAEAEAGATVETAREGFLAATRLNKLPALLEETRAGQVMVGQARQFLATSGWTKKRLLEVATFLAAGKTGEAVGGTIGVMRGTDGKTEAEAGRMLAETFTMWTVGDADALKEAAAAHGIAAQQLEAVAKQAELEGKAAEELAATSERHAAAIRETLPAEPGAGISAEGRQAAGRAKAQISQELQQLEREAAAGQAASAAQTKRIAVLKNAYEGAAAAEAGGEAEARAWVANVEDAAKEAGATKAQAQAVAAQVDEARARLASAETKASPVVEASEEAEGAGANTKIRPEVKAEGKAGGPGDKTVVSPDAEKPVAKSTPAAAPPPAPPSGSTAVSSLRTGNPLTKDLDQMWIQQHHAEALAGYEERQAALMQLGGATADVAAAEIPQKIAALREINELRAEIKSMSKPDWVPNYTEKVEPEEVAQLEAVIQREARLPLEERTVRLEPVTKNRLNASLTDPYWVYVKKDGEWVKIGIFKRSAKEGLERGLDLEAEEIYANFAQKFREQLGVEVPACMRSKMTVETREIKDVKVGTVVVKPPQPEDGLFVRWAPGTDLEKFGYYAPALFKKQIALDRVLAALFFDYDRKAGNFLVMDLEKLLSLDHGQAFIRGFSGEALASDDTVALFMGEMVAHWRNRTDIPTAAELYRLVDEQITIEDMGKSITFIEDLFDVGEEFVNGVKRVRTIENGPDQVRAILRASLKPDETEQVMRVLTARARVMRGVLKQGFGTLKDLKPIPVRRPPKTAQVEPCRGPDPIRSEPRSAEELPLAA